jgi:hypothetical protein
LVFNLINPAARNKPNRANGQPTMYLSRLSNQGLKHRYYNANKVVQNSRSFPSLFADECFVVTGGKTTQHPACWKSGETPRNANDMGWGIEAAELGNAKVGRDGRHFLPLPDAEEETSAAKEPQTSDEAHDRERCGGP